MDKEAGIEESIPNSIRINRNFCLPLLTLWMSFFNVRCNTSIVPSGNPRVPQRTPNPACMLDGISGQ